MASSTDSWACERRFTCECLGFIPKRGSKTVRDRHFTSISVEIWVQPLNVNGFLGLPGDLGGILVNYIEIRD